LKILVWGCEARKSLSWRLNFSPLLRLSGSSEETFLDLNNILFHYFCQLRKKIKDKNIIINLLPRPLI
jgi:hypothetical protein